MSVVLITGTSKGLGYALANLYLERGDKVIGVSRHLPDIDFDNYYHLQESVTSETVIANLRDFLENLPIEKIDVLINNAGTGSIGANLSRVEVSEVINQLNLHCIGVLRILKGAGRCIQTTKIVNITSRLGSLMQSARGDFDDRNFSYGYRIAKCAQNMLSLCLTSDSEMKDNMILSINPGLLKTDTGSSDALHTAEQGAEAVLEVIDNAVSSGIYDAFGGEAYY